jgi:hypothetical protein
MDRQNCTESWAPVEKDSAYVMFLCRLYNWKSRDTSAHSLAYWPATRESCFNFRQDKKLKSLLQSVHTSAIVKVIMCRDTGSLRAAEKEMKKYCSKLHFNIRPHVIFNSIPKTRLIINNLIPPLYIAKIRRS